MDPLLVQWKTVNDARCPECDRLIRVNMARHLRLVHSEYVCFWRCPVPSCSLWFMSELNAKDHIENIHRFREGRGMSFYKCLQAYGLEWFGNRSFFDGRRSANQSLWMDLALARRSGQDLRNHYIITKSPEFAPLRRFFAAAVDQLQPYTIHCWSLLRSLRPAPSSRRCVPPSKTVTTSHLRGASCCYLHNTTYQPPPYRWERPRPCRPS